MITPQHYKEALNLFVSTDQLKAAMLKPNLNHDCYYATDGHALFYFPSSLVQLDIGQTEKPIDFKPVIPLERNESITLSISNLSELFDTLIPKEKDSVECPECDGEGVLECNLGHEHDCDCCNGDGRIELKNGKMVADPYAALFLYECCFNASQLYRLAKACQILQIENLEWVNRSASKGNLFISGDYKINQVYILTEDKGK